MDSEILLHDGLSWRVTWEIRCEAILLQRGVFFHKRASVSKFYFRCFQNATGSSSAHRAVPELRIELPASLEHARGPEIDQKA